MPPPKKYSKEEIESKNGKFDQDGFYMLSGGDFFDPEGYYFNKLGFDEFGGFYDKNGDYLSPPGIIVAEDGGFAYVGDDDFEEDYDDYYNELNPDEEDDEDEEQQDQQAQEEEFDDEEIEDLGIDPNEITLGLRREHCLPVLKWLKDQPSDKKHVIKIANLPRRATE